MLAARIEDALLSLLLPSRSTLACQANVPSLAGPHHNPVVPDLWGLMRLADSQLV